MTESDRPLPSPPRSRFGRDSQDDAGPASSLTSDRMALAAAEGRLEEFLKHEIPQGDRARDLAMMMMGMSGMMPMGQQEQAPQAVSAQDPTPDGPDPLAADAPEVPPEALAAIQQGDVSNLVEILRAEHAKRSGRGAATDGAPVEPPGAALPPAAPALAPAAGRAGIDTAIINELIRISADSDVTVDWLMLRAVKLYVEEYRKTGRL